MITSALEISRLPSPSSHGKRCFRSPAMNRACCGETSLGGWLCMLFSFRVDTLAELQLLAGAGDLRDVRADAFQPGLYEFVQAIQVRHFDNLADFDRFPADHGARSDHGPVVKRDIDRGFPFLVVQRVDDE